MASDCAKEIITGVIKTPLKQFEDHRGKVMHMLRCDAPHFREFGEVYFSWVSPGAIKAWKLHKELIMNFAIPVGAIKLVLYDERSDSPTYGMLNEFDMSDSDYYLLTIPNNIWYGFRSLHNKAAMVVNCATLPHSPPESRTREVNDPSVPYSWET